MEKGKDTSDFWENTIYGKGEHMNRYPYDSVVTFIYRNFPRNKARENINILEVGCGAGNNLWFAAREGFNVNGIDGSRSAIEYARTRFENDGLHGEFKVGNFLSLPYDDDKFDLVIDRASITCNTLDNAKKIVEGINRVMTKNGLFFFNPYSIEHSSFREGSVNSDGTVSKITKGTLMGIEPLFFYSLNQIKELFPEKSWKIKSISHSVIKEELQESLIHAEFRVIVEKL